MKSSSLGTKKFYGGLLIMKILNYGAGAVGLGLDSFLIKAGNALTIIGRRKTVLGLRSKGLKRSGLFGPDHAAPSSFSAYESLADVPCEKFDFILASTKSFDSALAASDLKKHPRLWDPSTKIVLCQNGWGNAETFQLYFPQEQIFNARIITGFERPHPQEVKITVHAEAIHIGSLFQKDCAGVEPLCQSLSAAGIPAQTTPEIGKDLWAKMLYNCALNPLGAIFDVPYGDLGKNDSSRDLMDSIMDEIFVVLQAAGHQTHWPTADEYRKIFYSKYLPATAGHRSSTLQAIHAGKRTEIEALNGMIVQLANQRGIKAEVNRAVYEMVKFLETKKVSGLPS